MERLESLSFLRWVFKRIKPLLIVQVIALILSVIFSSQYFIPKEYKSYTIVYPYNMSEYSHETPTEQMLEFLNSLDIKNQVIERFHLHEHYNLPADGKPYFEKLYSTYDRNVNVKPTEYGAVELTVYDVSPDTAFGMVNGILDILNKKVHAIQVEKSIEVANMLKSAMDVRKHQIDSMSALSKDLSTKYGLLEYESQTREVERAYYQAIQSKGSKTFDELATQKKNLEDHGMEFRAVNQHIESALKDYNDIEVKYNDAMKDVTKKLTYWNMVSAPFRPDTYSYPLRSLIVLGTCFAAFVFSILVMRSTEKLKSARMKEPDGR